MKAAIAQDQPRGYEIPRYTISLVKEATSPFHAQTRCQSSEDVYRYFQDICADQDREHLYALFLDTKHAPIGLNHVSMGTLNTMLVHPREVFKCAVLLNAACLILVHNLCVAPHKLCYVTPQVMWSRPDAREKHMDMRESWTFAALPHCT